MYQKLFAIMRDYSPVVKMSSIDEGVIDFHGQPARDLTKIGYEIKARVRAELGGYVRINVGIGPNRFLAKTAANLHKPDGLDLINHHNLLEVYKSLKLQDLTGIADGYGSRLRSYGIFTPLDFLNASEQLLTRSVFRGVNGHYWYQRLRGYEIDGAPTKLGMVGRQWVVKNATADNDYLRSCMHFLAETTAMKLRYRGKSARGVCVWMDFQSGGNFYDKKTYRTAVYSNQDVWLRVTRLFDKRPAHMVVTRLGLYLYNLEVDGRSQIDLFNDTAKLGYLTDAMDEINDRYGAFTLYSADSLAGTKNVKQKIPFGGTEYFNLLLKRQ
jgi:DNA polymerase-4